MAALALADPVGSTGQAMFRGGRQPKRTAQAGRPTPARTGLAPRRPLRRDRSLPQRSRAAPLAALKARPLLASEPRAGAPSFVTTTVRVGGCRATAQTRAATDCSLLTKARDT